MEQSFSYPESLPKAERYAAFLADYRMYIEGETDLISIMANTAAALNEAFGYFWVGFYRVHDSEWLHLGPFQGPVACTRIKYGRGVCGSCWERNETIVVPDVNKFPGHIACSSSSQSEIVVPVHDKKGNVMAILDIDSTQLGAFDQEDADGLQAIIASLEALL